MDKLHPGAKWIFRLRAYYSLIGFGIFVFIVSLTLFVNSNVLLVIGILLFYILFMAIGSEVYARMAYNRYLYQISPHEVKIEKGIISKKYTSIPYERIQNVDIKRGIIARMFGFSTVDIETAGQSGIFSMRNRHNRRYESEGHLPAVDVAGAEKIREFVMKKVKQTHGSGL